MRLVDLLSVGTIVIACGLGCRFIRSDNLNQAASRGDMQAFRNSIGKRVDVNGRGMHAMTPLMKAAESGRSAICELLIKHGTDVNSQNDSGSVLMWAVNSGNEALVRFLLNSGTDKAWTNALGDGAYSLATKRGFTNIAAILKPER